MRRRFNRKLRDHRSEPRATDDCFPCLLRSSVVPEAAEFGRVVVMPLCQRGRMALFREQVRPPELPRGGVMADALVYGYTHHPAPLSMTTSGSPLAPLVRSALEEMEEPARPDHLGAQGLGPLPQPTIRGDEGDRFVARSCHDMDERVIATASAWITVTPSTRPLGTPCRDWPSRTTTTG